VLSPVLNSHTPSPPNAKFGVDTVEVSPNAPACTVIIYDVSSTSLVNGTVSVLSLVIEEVTVTSSTGAVAPATNT